MRHLKLQIPEKLWLGTNFSWTGVGISWKGGWKGMGFSHVGNLDASDRAEHIACSHERLGGYGWRKVGKWEGKSPNEKKVD